MSAEHADKVKLLVVDDERIVHDSVRRILEEEGYEVDGAFRVDEALNKLNAGSFDLVLTDLMMPDDSGLKAVEAVARDHPDTGVVMFTGYATVESAVESMKLGALDYLPKPFTPEELMEVIQRAVANVRKSRRDREIEQTYADAEKAIKSSLDLKEILDLISTSVARLLKVKGCCVYMHNRTDDTLELVSSEGLSSEYLNKGVVSVKESVPDVIRQGEMVIIDESQFDEKLQYPEEARKEGIATILSVPLNVKDAVLGMLRIYSADKKSLSDEEAELLRKFSDQAAHAVENAMAYKQLRDDIENIKKVIPGEGEGGK